MVHESSRMVGDLPVQDIDRCVVVSSLKTRGMQRLLSFMMVASPKKKKHSTSGETTTRRGVGWDEDRHVALGRFPWEFTCLFLLLML